MNTLTCPMPAARVTAGAATRRTMPAIAVVGAAWIGRMVLMAKLRPSLMTPTENVKLIGAMTTARPGGGEFDSACIATNDMMVGGNNVPFLDSHGGHHSAAVVMNQWCNDEALNSIAGGKRTGDPMVQCLQQHDIVGSLVQYQPASRMGTFHLIENGMNLGLLVVSLLVAWWCVRRTRTTT